MIYPKELLENLRWRAKIDQDASTDPIVAAKFKKLCEKDILFFFNSVLWTYDPREEIKDLPFITYEFQDKTILWIKEGIDKQEDGLLEKTRDMGVSWMVLGVLYHKWLFEHGFNALIGSYIEELVDSKDSLDSHFGRLEYLNNHTPNYLLPKKWNRTYMSLINYDTGAAIQGKAPTARFSRQGRYNVIWGDEFAFWQWGRAAWQAMGDATRCRLVTSTVNGKGDKFAELALKSKIKKLTLNYWLHPKKTAGWYEEEKGRRTPEEMAAEIDINYNKAVSGRVYPEFCERNYSEKQEYIPTQPLYVSWDFGLADETALIWFQIDKVDNTARIVDAYQNSNKTIDFYVPFINGEVKSLNVYHYTDHELEMIEKHKRWQPAIHYGDPTGENRSQVTATSVVTELRKHGIIVNSNRREFDLKTRIHKTKLLIRRLIVDKDLVDFIDAIENARYPERGENSQNTTPISKPIHDWTSHYRTALEYYAVNENLRGEKKSTVYNPNLDSRIKGLARKKEFL